MHLHYFFLLIISFSYILGQPLTYSSSSEIEEIQLKESEKVEKESSKINEDNEKQIDKEDQEEIQIKTEEENDKSNTTQNEYQKITESIIYNDKDDLTSICLTTNRGNIKYIGKQGDKYRKDTYLKGHQKIVLAFGITSSKQYGVTSMFCYYIDKKKYGVIQYIGLIQLKAKLAKDKEFHDKVEAKKGNLDEKLKLITEVCSLPSTAFFPIASYIMSN